MTFCGPVTSIVTKFSDDNSQLLLSLQVHELDIRVFVTLTLVNPHITPSAYYVFNPKFQELDLSVPKSLPSPLNRREPPTRSRSQDGSTNAKRSRTI